MAPRTPPDDGFQRSSGEGWWSVERNQDRPSQDPEEDSQTDPMVDLFDASLLSDPMFIRVCCALLVAQLITGIILYRASRGSTQDADETSKDAPQLKPTKSESTKRKLK